ADFHGSGAEVLLGPLGGPRSVWPRPLYAPRPCRAASAVAPGGGCFLGPDLVTYYPIREAVPGVFLKVLVAAKGFSPPAPSGWTMAQARAVSDAAQAAAQATQAAEAVMASAHEARRIEALSRFIQKPDMYRPDTREQEIDQWVDWRHVMRNYLGVIDSNYLVEMDLVEAATHEEVVREYERISGSTYPEDLKVSTLVNAAPGPLQVQLH
ncbi:unnamed protein product, partial [Symbiodinium necroappetens]